MILALFLFQYIRRFPSSTKVGQAQAPIELSRFLESGIALVECPDCASTRTLEPRGGVLRFKSHDKRKTRTLTTEPRWAMRETTWDVVGEEKK